MIGSGLLRHKHGCSGSLAIFCREPYSDWRAFDSWTWLVSRFLQAELFRILKFEFSVVLVGY